MRFWREGKIVKVAFCSNDNFLLTRDTTYWNLSQTFESVRTSCIVLWKCKSMRGSNLGLLRSYIAGIDYQP